MADHSMALNDTLMQLGGEDFLRELTEPPRFSGRVFSPRTQAAITPFPMEA